MRLHEFGLLVIILLFLISILILCSICSIKIYKFLYGTYDFNKNYDIPIGVTAIKRTFNYSTDQRAIQTRIKLFRRPYRKMRESHARNMPPIVEVNTPVDSEYYSDTKGDEFDANESTERVSVSTENGGVSNFWKRDTIIIL